MKRLFPVLFFLVLLASGLLAGCSSETSATVESITVEPTTVPVTPAPASVSAAGGYRTFEVVPSESSAFYLVDEEFFAAALTKYNIPVGKKITVGRTSTIAGSLALDLDAAQPLGPTRFTVDLPSLTSDQSLRDGWIRDNALESSQYPEALFVATSVEGAPTAYEDGQEVEFQLLGQLTVRAVTIPATFDVTATLNGDTIKGVAEAKVKMSDFGITPPNFANTLVVADPFTIRIELTAQEQQ